MKLTPIGPRVLIKLDKPKEVAGSIHLPQNALERPYTGTVQAVGNGGRTKKTGTRIPVDVKVGDHVLLAKFSGTEVELNGETLLFVHVDDLSLVL